MLPYKREFYYDRNDERLSVRGLNRRSRGACFRTVCARAFPDGSGARERKESGTVSAADERYGSRESEGCAGYLRGGRKNRPVACHAPRRERRPSPDLRRRAVPTE